MTDTAVEPPVLRIATNGDADRLRSGARAATSAGVRAVGSTGVAGIEPLAMATHDGGTAFYYGCSADRVEAVATGLEAGEPPEPDAHTDGGPTTGLPDPGTGPLAVGERRLLAGCGWRRPDSAEDYRAAGGFVGPALDAADAISLADEHRGRGWGDVANAAPVAPVWRASAEADGAGAVVVNAHGTESDELLASSDPLAVLDGAAVAATAIDADEVYVYTAEGAEGVRERVSAAAAAFPGDLDVAVVSGPDSYRAAEPTMAIEAIEGADRLEARLRPPGPESTGLHGRPTLVHTPRTLASIAATGRGESGDTRLLTVTGDVSSSATVELSTDESIGAALDATTVEGAVKAVCVGGRFGGLTASLDTAVGVDALASAGLGTEATLEVLATDRCIVAFAGKRTQWASETNCGRCVPCREGSTQLAELLRAVYDGTVPSERVDELARVMERSSICQFGRDAPRPARTALVRFTDEFHAHAAGDCPAGVCERSAEVSG